MLIPLLSALCVPAEAQQAKKIPRIGYISASGDAKNPGANRAIEAFQQGLRDLGYVEGKNLLIEYRYAEAKLDREAG